MDESLQNIVDNNCKPEVKMMIEDEDCASSPSSPARIWSTDDTLLLISLLKENDKKIQITTNKIVFTDIANKVSAASGIPCTHCQAESKWKCLKRTYKRIKDNPKIMETRRVQWPFFSDMDQFLGKKPDVVPVAICSTMFGLRSDTAKREINFEEQQNGTDSDSDTPVQLPPSAPCVRKRRRRNAANLAGFKRRHQENKQMHDRFMNLFDQYLQKL